MFKDEVTIRVKSGRGGNGGVSFRREKYEPFGGPDGGHGGKGGDVIIVTDRNLNTLYHMVHVTKFRAEDGGKGDISNCSGKNGRDVVLRVPIGTIVRDIDKNVIIKDLDTEGGRVIIAAGGKGGRGNKTFATPVNQAPRRFEKGGEGEERKIFLELKLIADAGLIGLPNAGKSTLIARISSARPKVADYPFTTLQPYLGIVDGGDFRTCVVADLPGLIEGAHQGAGLGDKFLRHIERTRMVVHLIDVSPQSDQPPVEAYRIIRKELTEYSRDLAEKREIVVATKMDVTGAEKGLRRLKKEIEGEVIPISAATGKGIDLLVRRIFADLSR
ncbi:MAG: GTPase ObgE [Planctomycetes bacterium RBG_16_59_8]|nr:MAG: GTPase ObgE [Planctomycetes bacterium RBG_16_59_8]